MIVGVGTDIVEISRLKDNQEKLAQKILTKNEYEVYKLYNNHRALEYLAGRIAAKEAIIKALDYDTLMSEIEIMAENKKPTCKIEGYRVNLSISHEKEYAIAFVVIEK